MGTFRSPLGDLTPKENPILYCHSAGNIPYHLLTCMCHSQLHIYLLLCCFKQVTTKWYLNDWFFIGSSVLIGMSSEWRKIRLWDTLVYKTRPQLLKNDRFVQLSIMCLYVTALVTVYQKMIPYELLNTETEYGGHKYFGKKIPQHWKQKKYSYFKKC